jgi:hypothetical protein
VNDTVPAGYNVDQVELSATGESVGVLAGPQNNLQPVLWAESGSVTDLVDPLPGPDTLLVVSINSANESVGYNYNNFVNDRYSGSAVEWSATGQATLLSDLGGYRFDQANAINDAGGIAGESGVPVYGVVVPKAAYWSSPSSGILLARPDNEPSYAYGINNTGDIFGSYDITEGFSYTNAPIVWNETGKILWKGSGSGNITAINAKGQTCGEDNKPGIGEVGVIWSPTGVEKVLGNPTGTAGNIPVAINASAATCGYTGNGLPIGWKADGQAILLQTPAGVTPDGFANAINKRGDMVGMVHDAPGEAAAFWAPNGTLTDLSSALGSSWTSTDAIAINNKGDILGEGSYNGQSDSFLLVPAVSASIDHPHYVVESQIHRLLGAKV